MKYTDKDLEHAEQIIRAGAFNRYTVAQALADERERAAQALGYDSWEHARQTDHLELIVLAYVRLHEPVTSRELQVLVAEQVRGAVRNLTEDGRLKFNLEMKLVRSGE